MNEPIQCRRTDDGLWEYFTAAGWFPTPWCNYCAWEQVKRWFAEQGKRAEWVRDAEKLKVLQ
jgi:hypothetical protein